jgi:hypothetical protein
MWEVFGARAWLEGFALTNILPGALPSRRLRRIPRACLATFKGLVAAIIGATGVEVLHEFGWFPDKKLAGLIMQTPTLASSTLTYALLVAVIALPLLFAEHWLGPFISGWLTRERPEGSASHHEIPPQFLRWRWWYKIWAGAPFHSYEARKRLAFMDSWSRFCEGVSSEGAQSRGITQIATARVLPLAQYNKAEIKEISDAIRAFYPPLLEMEQTLRSGTELAGSLEALIRDRGAAQLLAEMDQLRLKLLNPSDRLDKAVEHFGLYTEVCKSLNERKTQHDAFFAAYNDLTRILREIPDQLSAAALAIFVETRKKIFIERTASYLAWVQRKKKALTEYREWYLRQPTTD